MKTPSKPRALFIEHDPVSPGGQVWKRFQQRGFEIVRFNIVPPEHFHTPNVSVQFPDFTAYDVLVPMGAPWGVWQEDLIGNWLLPELSLIRSAHAAGIPILGICFGGQLMARALGGSVAPGPQSEVGWTEVRTHARDGFPPGPWFESHNDRWQLPPGAIELASTELASQAFRLDRTLAVQFHPEINPETLEVWLRNGDDIKLAAHGVDVPALVARTAQIQYEAAKRTHALVDYFLDQVARQPPPRQP
jgi:GMP synthase-like glutamine amidotransferase